MSSFDIISKIDTVELNNPVDSTKHKLTTRFHFTALLQISNSVNNSKISTKSNFQINQILDILGSNLAKYSIDAYSMETKDSFHTYKIYFKDVPFKRVSNSILLKNK